MSKKGSVFYQEHLAGVIEETDEGYEFTYAEEYLETKNAKPVSLTLPLSTEKYTSKVLFAFFGGLIPEGWLLDPARVLPVISNQKRACYLMIVKAPFTMLQPDLSSIV